MSAPIPPDLPARTADLPVGLGEEDVAFAGVVGQRELLRSGRLTSVQLVSLALRRAARLDPRLNAFRVLFVEQALAEAQAADEARARGEGGALLGLPIAVKDSMTLAGHAAAMGTRSPEPVARRDGELVRRLKAAGAVVVGTTHLPELALWPFTESAGWGATRNPWGLDHTPGGSSGGSSAAVAAGIVPLATASDGGGSIRIPAACCGLPGLKPTVGRVPLGMTADTADEHWQGLSSYGVLTRTVADAAVAYEVLFQTALPLQAPGQLRIAVSTKPAAPAPVDARVVCAVEETADRLRALGHEVIAADPDLAGVQESFLVRYAVGVREDLARLVDPSATELRTRAVAAVGRRLGPRLLTRARRLGDEVAARPLPAGAQVLLTPVLGGQPLRVGALTGLGTLLRSGRAVPFTPPWNVAGMPAMSVPVGRDADGLPLAVQIVAARGEDLLLLRLAAQLEDGAPDRPLVR